MSLYKDASLVMIPSAYKDGKLYSIRPTDGSGDFTFSRGSNLAATRVDVNGLIEKGRENLLLQSNQFDTTWALTNTSVTSAQNGYDGSSNAWQITASATSSSFVRQFVNVTSQVSTLSVYAKAGNVDWIYLNCVGVTAYYDLTNGVIGTTTGGGNLIDTKIVSVGNGWWRISITGLGIEQQRIYVANGNLGFDTAIGEYIYIQDAQLEAGLVATDYIETGASTAQAGILEDMPRLDYSGGASCPALLLEPQRTNLFDHSEYLSTGSGWADYSTTITPNAAISPEGVQNATGMEIIDTQSRLQFNAAQGAGTYTFSVYARSDSPVNMRLRPSVDGVYEVLYFTTTSEWTRYEITFTATTSVGLCQIRSYQEVAGNIEIYGFQLEAGSYPTSYIPTYGSSVTRSQENHQLNITPIITSSSFTWFFDLGDWVGSATNGGTYELINTGSTRIQLRVRLDGYRMYYQNTNGGSAYPVAGSKTANKFCLAYDGLNYRLFIDGSLVNTYPSVGDTNWSFLMNTGGNGVYETLIIKQEVLFPTALTDSECIALTTI